MTLSEISKILQNELKITEVIFLTETRIGSKYNHTFVLEGKIVSFSFIDSHDRKRKVLFDETEKYIFYDSDGTELLTGKVQSEHHLVNTIHFIS